MQMYCPRCNRECLTVTPDVTKERRFLLGAKMVCPNCLARYKLAERMAEQARQQTTDLPEFFEGLFK